jgi:stage II sporulation SpoD-like protein
MSAALLALGTSIALGLPAPVAAAGQTGRVRGEVLSWETKRPVAGATVSIPAFDATATSERDGSFAFAEPFPVSGPLRRIRALVTAPGFGRWTISGVPMYPNDTLILHAELRATAWSHRVLSPAERLASARPTQPDRVPESSALAETCSGWDYLLVPPPNIWVYVTPDKKAEKFVFVWYATHVLPNEWIASWDADALGAGAIAVKTYAAYRTMTGHARTSGSGCYDILDTTSDQIFDPTWSNAATDRAVDATLGSVLYQNGSLFLSHYFAGAPGDKCAPVSGQYAGWMSQWGTQTCAKDDGEVWPDIVTTFYANTSWHSPLHDFLLAATAQSAATYPWTTASASFVRVRGGAHSDTWWFSVTPVAGKTGTFRQERPYNRMDEPTTSYHANVALLCPTSNRSSCSISMKVIAIFKSGSEVVKTTTITEPRDGVWRVYNFRPTFSVGHVSVRLSLVSAQKFGVDDAYLDSPFG